MSSSTRRSLLVTFVLFHLGLVACWAFELMPWRNVPVLEDVIAGYSEWTGAAAAYGYFSPAVPDQVAVMLTAVDATGHREVEQISTASSAVELRASSAMFLFHKLELDDLQARSLAAYSFGRYPQAEQVIVSLRLYRVPTMERYRAGDRPYLDEYYRGVFVHDDLADDE